MTKSKKMKKSTFAIVIMAILMVAMLAFGGTYAYFTASATGATQTAKMGHVKLGANGTLTATSGNLVPGDTLFTGNVGFQNNSNVKTIVLAKFALTYTGYIYDEDGVTTDEEYEDAITPAQAMVDTTHTTGKLVHVTDYSIETSVLTGLSIDSTKWTPVATGVYIYGVEGNYAVAPTETKVAAQDAINLFTGNSTTITLDKNIARHYVDEVYQAGTDGELAWEDASVTITVSFTQCQYDNLTLGEKAEYTEAGAIALKDGATDTTLVAEIYNALPANVK